MKVSLKASMKASVKTGVYNSRETCVEMNIVELLWISL